MKTLTLTISLSWFLLGQAEGHASDVLGSNSATLASRTNRLSVAEQGLAYTNAMLNAGIGLPHQVVAPVRVAPSGAPARAGTFQPMDDTPVCAPAPAGLVGWWMGEGDVSNALLPNDGSAAYGGVGFDGGEVGQAFSFDGSSGYVEVPDSPWLRLTDELTIEFWVQRRGPMQADDYIINKGGDCTWGSLNYGVTLNSAQWGYALAFTFAGDYRRSVSIADNDWHHIAVVARNGDMDPTFYVDGVEQPVTDEGWWSPIYLYPSTKPLHLGAQIDPDSGWNIYSSALVDEISLYNTALTAQQIQAIYAAGAAGKCPQVPPAILVQPQGQRAPVGGNASLNVLASGTPTLSYQWYHSGQALPNGTDSTLALANLQLSDAGTYSVIVNNDWGSAASAEAVLEVYNPVCVQPPAGLVGWWAGENDAHDALCQHNGTISGGVSFLAGMAGQAFSFDGASGYVEVPDSPSLQLATVVTIEFWVKRRGDMQADDYIINKGGDFTRGGLNYGVTLNSAQWGYALAFTFAGGYRRSAAIADNNWHHVAVVARNGDPNPSFYLDGTPQGVSDGGGSGTINLYPSTEALHIGAQIDPLTGWICPAAPWWMK